MPFGIQFFLQRRSGWTFHVLFARHVLISRLHANARECNYWGANDSNDWASDDAFCVWARKQWRLLFLRQIKFKTSEKRNSARSGNVSMTFFFFTKCNNFPFSISYFLSTANLSMIPTAVGSRSVSLPLANAHVCSLLHIIWAFCNELSSFLVKSKFQFSITARQIHNVPFSHPNILF